MSMINLFSGHALRCPHAQNVMSWNMGQGQNKMVEALIASTWKLHVLQALVNDVSRVLPQQNHSHIRMNAQLNKLNCRTYNSLFFVPSNNVSGSNWKLENSKFFAVTVNVFANQRRTKNKITTEHIYALVYLYLTPKLE